MHITRRYIAASEKDFEGVAKQLLRAYPVRRYRLWLLSGPLGAGKTTLVRALARELGIRKRVTSPTFSLIISYRALKNIVLHHIDLYRITRRSELGPMGLFDVCADNRGICAIEWPEKFSSAFYGKRCVKISIAPLVHGRRISARAIIPAAGKRRTRHLSPRRPQQQPSHSKRK